MSTPSSSPVCVQFRTEQLGLSAGVPLGSGAISHVTQCRLRCAAHPSLPVVVKIVSKLQVLQQGKVQSVMNEKAALQRLAPHPYIARLYGTSQSEDELYYVLEWLPHGDLLQHIRRVHAARLREYAATTTTGDGAPTSFEAEKLLSIPRTSSALRCLDFHDIQLITAQLVLALTRAAEKGVVLRDLKPENVAFDEKYRACLLDFDTVDLDGAAVVPETNNGVACPPPCGDAADVHEEGSHSGAGDGSAIQPRSHASSTTASVKATEVGNAEVTAPPRRRLTVSEIQGMRKKSASFCGTAQYVSPEMVGECKWSFSSDLWALGALVYELAYGTHLFAGLSQFEVLQKIIQGNYVENANLFPPIDFKTSHAVEGATEQPTSNTTTSGDSYFAALKSFIQQLLNVDPAKRLGVHPTTHKFDAAALRGHPLFRDFAWEVVDEQLRTFQPRSFAASGTADASAEASPRSKFGPGRSAFDLANERAHSSADSDDDAVVDEAGLAEAAAAAKAALDDLQAASVDSSPSLATHYHIKPFNDPAYAEYVYKATADANPFEKFFFDTAKAETDAGAKSASAKATAISLTNGKAAPSLQAAGNSAAAERVQAAAVAQPANTAADTHGTANNAEAEEDDVIDDVGIRYVGTHAHPDFQE